MAGCTIVIDWRSLTPQELLDGFPRLSMDQCAYILGFVDNSGKLDRAGVHKLVRSGRIRLIDDSQPITRWSIAQLAMRLYIAGDRRAATGFALRPEDLDAWVRGQSILAIDTITCVGPRKTGR